MTARREHPVLELLGAFVEKALLSARNRTLVRASAAPLPTTVNAVRVTEIVPGATGLGATFLDRARDRERPAPADGARAWRLSEPIPARDACRKGPS